MKWLVNRKKETMQTGHFKVFRFCITMNSRVREVIDLRKNYSTFEFLVLIIKKAYHGLFKKIYYNSVHHIPDYIYITQETILTLLLVILEKCDKPQCSMNSTVKV